MQTLMKSHSMWHFICVFTVWKSTHLLLSSLKRVNSFLASGNCHLVMIFDTLIVFLKDLFEKVNKIVEVFFDTKPNFERFYLTIYVILFSCFFVS